MADQPALRRAFADYARTIARRYDIGEVLYQLTDQVVEVFAIDGAGVSIGEPDGGLRFVTATDDRVSRVEEEQIDSREGPCHDAYRSGDRVTASDLEREDRWPTYTSVALGEGLRAAAGIPLVVGDERIGALNLYSSHPREWPADELDDAQLLADMATGYILNARILTERERLAAQLQHALDSRIVIEQAKGVIAERLGIDTATAFDRLRAHARRNSTKLHEVAQAVIDQRLQL